MSASDEISEYSEKLVELAKQLRLDKRLVDSDVMGKITSATRRIRNVYDEQRAACPPKEYDDMHWNTGWCIYEASLSLLSDVKATWGIIHHAGSAVAAQKVEILADCARELPWPQYSPRALGAIRCEALVESKLDTPLGYDTAWNTHRESIKKYEDFSLALVGEDKKYIVGLEETFIQLGVAEIGTACRQAERVIGRWAEGVKEELWDLSDQDSWMQQLFWNLREGALNGERTLDTVQRVDLDYGGFVEEVGKDRMTLKTAYRQPGIMTARAWLLLVPMCTQMARWGLRSPSGRPWPEEQQSYLNRAEAAFRKSLDTCGLAYSDDHRRSLVQLRLNLALIAPGCSMPLTANLPEDCLRPDPLDDSAVRGLSEWLEARDGDDANAIGSATMPVYLRAVYAARTAATRKAVRPTTIGYRQWREGHMALDRYRDEPGRAERVAEMFDSLPDEGAE